MHIRKTAVVCDCCGAKVEVDPDVSLTKVGKVALVQQMDCGV